MKPFIIAIATSVLATAAAASLLALPAKEVKEKKSPRRLGQTHAEPPSSSTLPAEEFSEETLSRRLGMTQAESTPISDTVTYIVQFEDTAAAPGDRCKALAMANGGIVVHVYKEVVNGCSLSMPRTEVGVYSGDEIIALGDYPKVAHVEEDRTVYAFEDGEDNIFDSSSKVQTRAVAQTSLWNLDRVDQCTRPLNNQATKNSASGVKVYVLDTGIHASHEEFRGLIGPTDCHYNAVEARALTDNNGHGSHVAATVCGHKSGVAANCTLCSVKVLGGNGQGTLSGVIAGIDFVVKQCQNNKSPCVINMSLGTGSSALLTKAVENAVAANVSVVVAAGNSNANACGTSPAKIPVALTVGSTTKTDARSSFSNFGNCVDVFAPGSDITSAWKCSSSSSTQACKSISNCQCYKTISGTSMASPLVAGLVAAIRSRNKNLTPAQARNEIVNKAFLASSTTRIATVKDCRRPAS